MQILNFAVVNKSSVPSVNRKKRLPFALSSLLGYSVLYFINLAGGIWRINLLRNKLRSSVNWGRGIFKKTTGGISKIGTQGIKEIHFGGPDAALACLPLQHLPRMNVGKK